MDSTAEKDEPKDRMVNPVDDLNDSFEQEIFENDEFNQFLVEY